MKRLLFNFAAAVSVVVVAAVLLLWVRSYFVADSFSFFVPLDERVGVGYGSWSGRGAISLNFYVLSWHSVSPVGDDNAAKAWWHTHSLESATPYTWFVFRPRWIDPQASATQPSMRSRAAVLMAPHWMLVIVAAVLPSAWVAGRVRRRRRRQRGRCVTCGYDLRATPEVCPECGTAPSAT